ncbi:MAG: hypothetical protein FWG36_09860 [Oscillospiraceae bacterium]|nr:hypothetical protein [Oscillospiraceae bacterium]
MIKRTNWLVIRIILLVLALFAATFIPTLRLETKDMNAFEGKYVTVYYETEEAAAEDIFKLTEEETERLAKTLGVSTMKMNIYIYDRQRTFQTKKYGYIAPLFGLDSYVGDSRKHNVLLTSPANPGKELDYNGIKKATVHEMTHIYNTTISRTRKPAFWVDNGIAGYLAGQNPRDDDFVADTVPSLRQMRTSNPILFANMHGKPLSYTYIEYLDKTYGWDKVLILADLNDFNRAFGVSEEIVYDDWVAFLNENYGGE